jgi:DNA invertase Pin-like site-specific DNA recombinase
MRQARRVGQPVVTETLKADIRRLAQQGKKQVEIAVALRVSQTTVSRVLLGKR